MINRGRIIFREAATAKRAVSRTPQKRSDRHEVDFAFKLSLSRPAPLLGHAVREFSLRALLIPLLDRTYPRFLACSIFSLIHLKFMFLAGSIFSLINLIFGFTPSKRVNLTATFFAIDVQSIFAASIAPVLLLLEVTTAPRACLLRHTI